MKTRIPRTDAPPAIPMKAYSVDSRWVANYYVRLVLYERGKQRLTFIPKNPATRAPVPTPRVAIDTLMSNARRAFRPESSISSAISCVDCIFACLSADEAQ
jgi:hypothetical protein